MKPLAVAALACLLTIGSRAATQAADQNPDRAMGILQQGAVDLDRGHLRNAVRVFKAALEADLLDPPQMAVAHGNLCMAYGRMGRFTTALGHCNRAIEINPLDWRLYNNRGHAHMGRSEVSLAVADFEKALALGPGQAVIAANLAAARNKTGD